MTKALITQEVAIVIAVPSQNPSLLSEDFLKYSGIVPLDWQLARAPVYDERVAQLVFENGFSLALQADRVMFLEAIGEKTMADTTIAEVTCKYVEALKLANFQAFGLNFRSYISYGTDSDAASDFVNTQVLTPRKWTKFTDKPVKATVNMNYELNNGKALNLAINEASIQFPEKEPESIVLFSANFNQDLKSVEPEAKILKIQELARNWQQDLQTLNELINESFFDNTAFPESRSKVITKKDKDTATMASVAIEDAAPIPV
jgi:hypothetical protein